MTRRVVVDREGTTITLLPWGYVLLGVALFVAGPFVFFAGGAVISLSPRGSGYLSIVGGFFVVIAACAIAAIGLIAFFTGALLIIAGLAKAKRGRQS